MVSEHRTACHCYDTAVAHPTCFGVSAEVDDGAALEKDVRGSPVNLAGARVHIEVEGAVLTAP